VVLGKILSKQSKTGAAREIYEKGCQATQGENAYIWQVSVQVCFACGDHQTLIQYQGKNLETTRECVKNLEFRT